MARTLEDFIKDYLTDRSIALGAKGYAKWISEYGVSPSVERAQALTKADTSYRASLSGYGKNAEGLANAGLERSGYAQYLNSVAKSKQGTALAGAALTESKSTAKGLKEYAGYLEGIENERLKSYERAVKSIQSDKLASYDEAYERAISFGLDEESAKNAATEASEAVRATLRQKLLTEIATKRMTSEATRAYALTLGLGEKIANELAEYAHRLNESVGSDGMTQSYLEYLKGLLKESD